MEDWTVQQFKACTVGRRSSVCCTRDWSEVLCNQKYSLSLLCSAHRTLITFSRTIAWVIQAEHGTAVIRENDSDKISALRFETTSRRSDVSSIQWAVIFARIPETVAGSDQVEQLSYSALFTFRMLSKLSRTISSRMKIHWSLTNIPHFSLQDVQKQKSINNPQNSVLLQ